jgi:hypothetical protein
MSRSHTDLRQTKCTASCFIPGYANHPTPEIKDKLFFPSPTLRIIKHLSRLEIPYNDVDPAILYIQDVDYAPLSPKLPVTDLQKSLAMRGGPNQSSWQGIHGDYFFPPKMVDTKVLGKNGNLCRDAPRPEREPTPPNDWSDEEEQMMMGHYHGESGMNDRCCFCGRCEECSFYGDVDGTDSEEDSGEDDDADSDGDDGQDESDEDEESGESTDETDEEMLEPDLFNDNVSGFSLVLSAHKRSLYRRIHK